MKNKKKQNNKQRGKKKPHPPRKARSAPVKKKLNIGDIGNSIVDGLGRVANRFLGQITGRGEYRVNRNTLWTGQVPSFSNGQAGTDIIHREFVANVSGSTTFSSFTNFINPGLAGSYPWMAQIAEAYEEYEIMGMVYEFKTTSGTAVGSTNTALGTVIMATNYDVNDVNFSSKAQMEAYEFSTSCVPCANMYHPIECSPSQTVLTKKYVRNEGITPALDADLRFYDHGKFQIATVGMQQTNVVGELWVSYHLRFYKPKLRTIAQFPNGVASFIESPAATATSTAAFATTGPVQVENNLGITPIYISGTALVKFVVPTVGYYAMLVATAETATAVASVINIPTTSVNLVNLNVLFGNTSSNVTVGSAAASINVKFFSCINNLLNPDITNTIDYTPRTGTYVNGRTNVFFFALPETFVGTIQKASDAMRLQLLEDMVNRLVLSTGQYSEDDVVSVCSSSSGRQRVLNFH